MEAKIKIDIPHLVESEKHNLALNFETCFDKTWKAYNSMQKDGLKGDLCYIYISFLRSGVLLHDAWFQLDFFDERNWGDLTPCSVDWQTDIISNEIYSYVNKLYHKKMTAREKDKLLLQYSEETKDEIKNILPHILQMKKAEYPNLTFQFGDFMGNYIVL